MKKGFTLIELLIVIVIVGILVTVALPKYKSSQERARGLEALANARALSEAANTYYILHYNSYRGITGSVYGLSNDTAIANITKNKYFKPTTSLKNGSVIVRLVRQNLGTKQYTIIANNTDGELTHIYCSGYEPYCRALGLSLNEDPGS